MTQLSTVIERIPMRQMTIKHLPFSPGNYVIKLRRPLSQQLGFYDAVEDRLIPTGERENKTLESVSLPSKRRTSPSSTFPLNNQGQRILIALLVVCNNLII